MKAFLLLFLRGYQITISPMLGQNCRFYPSCSNYALEAISTHGAAKGCWLAGKRLCKCHPWHVGGIDMVPPKSTAYTDAEVIALPTETQADTQHKTQHKPQQLFRHAPDEKTPADPILVAGSSFTTS
ncbi:MAG: membrane protein insertion efficiency factor YidD [Undibacterium sp.]|nr:membrane protein insertion efficiency factor YidD [Undibacterium sp.]